MAPAEAPLRIELAYSPQADAMQRVQLQLAPGACVRDALQASGWFDDPAIAALAAQVGVWGRRQPLEHPLRDRDRVEVYRPLTVDPKEARRQRFRRQGKTPPPG
jgi:putative ubiquitin-RnfH superfamily antitoxin RatB of RatAB toxin-antitoxin module